MWNYHRWLNALTTESTVVTLRWIWFIDKSTTINVLFCFFWNLKLNPGFFLWDASFYKNFRMNVGKYCFFFYVIATEWSHCKNANLILLLMDVIENKESCKWNWLSGHISNLLLHKQLKFYEIGLHVFLDIALFGEWRYINRSLKYQHADY